MGAGNRTCEFVEGEEGRRQMNVVTEKFGDSDATRAFMSREQDGPFWHQDAGELDQGVVELCSGEVDHGVEGDDVGDARRRYWKADHVSNDRAANAPPGCGGTVALSDRA
jgi:hypothetical protein